MQRAVLVLAIVLGILLIGAAFWLAGRHDDLPRPFDERDRPVSRASPATRRVPQDGERNEIAGMQQSVPPARFVIVDAANRAPLEGVELCAARSGAVLAQSLRDGSVE